MEKTIASETSQVLRFLALTPFCLLQLLRFCPDCMIGKKVRVFWPVDSSWYTGIVQKYNAETGEHLLKYDDDDTEWVRIGESAAGGANQTTRGSNSPSRTSSGERISPIPTSLPLAGEPYDANTAWQGGNRPPYPPYSAAQGQAPPGPPRLLLEVCHTHLHLEWRQVMAFPGAFHLVLIPRQCLMVTRRI